MLTIITTLLLSAPVPPNICRELHVELRRAVEEGWLIDKEAAEIHQRCLNTAP